MSEASMLRPQDLLVGESDSQNFYFVYSVRVRRLVHVRFGWHTVEGVGHGLRSHNSAAARRRRTVETQRPRDAAVLLRTGAVQTQ